VRGAVHWACGVALRSPGWVPGPVARVPLAAVLAVLKADLYARAWLFGGWYGD
jgi:hypothetical protein